MIWTLFTWREYAEHVGVTDTYPPGTMSLKDHYRIVRVGSTPHSPLQSILCRARSAIGRWSAAHSSWQQVSTLRPQNGDTLIAMDHICVEQANSAHAHLGKGSQMWTNEGDRVDARRDNHPMQYTVQRLVRGLVCVCGSRCRCVRPCGVWKACACGA